ncbi:MAG: flagellar biosynthesis protein FlhF [Bdellovibrionaceae bacterium]|nr:flagellar biosynthesis protein FlhF [Pseudobdellovibrionaceae bacterium]|tara:strand:- start:21308 stop:22918 length:1611 start_codon:yes stop_codon:yes gene_type:complete
MQVRKYEARTMQEALVMVKQELGPEAIILHAKDNVSSFGLGGQSSVEVTAAVSEETLRKKQLAEKKLNKETLEKFKNSSAASQKKFISKVFDDRQPVKRTSGFSQIPYVDIDDEEEDGASRRGSRPDLNGRSVQEAMNIAVPMQTTFQEKTLDYNQIRQQRRDQLNRRGATQRPVRPSEGISLEEVAKMVQPKATNVSQENEADAMPLEIPEIKESVKNSVRPAIEELELNAKHSAEVTALKDQILQLQKIIADFQKVPQSFITQHPGASEGISYELSAMFEKLTGVGISTENAVEILKLAQEELPKPQLKKQAYIDAWVAKYILANTKTIDGIGNKKYQVFVGPSGQGKTASLVKMASLLSLKMRKKVAILSTDTSRVGVAEQLRIFAQILNVPFAIIQKSSDWAVVEERLGSVDYILVDTPGFQLKTPEEMAIMSQMLPPVASGRAIHYVQSALAKDESAFEIASRYRRFAFEDVIFTNLDETHQHGIIYNFQKKYEVPLHSFGIGPRIPEDIEMATKERMVDLIFKLTKMRKD